MNGFIMKKTTVFYITALLFSLLSCTCDNEEVDYTIKITSTNVSLLPSQSYNIGATSTKKITYTTENNFNATVSELGIITSGKVGSTNIILSNGVDSKTIKVTTYSTNLLYPDPVLTFGVSKSTIITKLGTPSYQESNGNYSSIRYDDATNTTDGTGYFFTDDKLTMVQTRVKSAYSSQLTSYLTDRFVPAGQIDGIFVFFNAIDAEKVTVGVGLQLYNSSYWNVTYSPSQVKLSTPIPKKGFF